MLGKEVLNMVYKKEKETKEDKDEINTPRDHYLIW